MHVEPLYIQIMLFANAKNANRIISLYIMKCSFEVNKYCKLQENIFSQNRPWLKFFMSTPPTVMKPGG